MSVIHLAAALLMVTIWGFNFIVIRWGLDGIPPLLLTLLRFALAAFPALLFVARPRSFAALRLIAAYGVFAFALQFALLFAGMAAGMPTGLASLVIQVQAFFTIALVTLLLRERPTTLLAFGIWAWLLRRHPAATTAPFTLLVPVVGMSCAVWLLGEPMTWWKTAGAALVLSAMALNVLVSRRR